MIKFKDLPNTETPVTAENLNANFDELNSGLTACKTISFNGGWIEGNKIYGAGIVITIPIYNPNKIEPTVNLTTAQVFHEGQWKDITYSTRQAHETFVTVVFADDYITVGDSCLVRLTGTISVK